MTARSSWKRTEREVARRLGGRRVPVSGRQRGDVPDVEHPLWSVEVKHWAQLPARVLDAMSQAIAASRGDQVPIAVLHQAGEEHGSDLVVIRLDDFVELYGPLPNRTTREVER